MELKSNIRGGILNSDAAVEQLSSTGEDLRKISRKSVVLSEDNINQANCGISAWPSISAKLIVLLSNSHILHVFRAFHTELSDLV